MSLRPPSSTRFLGFFAAAAIAASLGSVPAWGWGIVTSSEYASQAGIQMLKKGGNAVDAAIAAAFTLGVATPHKMGIGGGGFILVGEKGKVTAVNHREMAPASAHAGMFLDENGKPIPYYPDRVTGPNPVGIPGTVAGFAQVHKRWGKLPWKTVLQPAIDLAKSGFPISPNVERDIEKNWSRIEKFAATKSTFSTDGERLQKGQVLRQPMMARTLETVAEKGAKEFYSGTLAKNWVREARGMGIKITEADLKNYKVSTEQPIKYEVFGKQAYTQGPPSGSGIAVGGPLRFLDQFYKKNSTPVYDSVERFIVSLEALAHFQQLRTKTIADRESATIDVQAFYGSKEEKAAWTEIETKIEKRKSKVGTRVTRRSNLPFADRMPEYGSTAQVSVVDDRGLSVSLTNTIEEIFGSGITIPKHGFLINNELSDFDAEPGKPNSAAAGKRPRSSMSPTLLYDGPHLVAVLGASGGMRIHTSIVLFLENYFIHKLNAKTALATARIHPIFKGEELTVEVEDFMKQATIEALKESGYSVDVRDAVYTYPQMLIRREKTAQWEAASDPRYDGMGVIY